MNELRNYIGGISYVEENVIINNCNGAHRIIWFSGVQQGKHIDC